VQMVVVTQSSWQTVSHCGLVECETPIDVCTLGRWIYPVDADCPIGNV